MCVERLQLQAFTFIFSKKSIVHVFAGGFSILKAIEQETNVKGGWQ